MTIILFLVDTSASMNQRAYVDGVPKTYLAIAKASVDIFLKSRQRSRDCLGDRYMLLTCDEPPKNMKSAWKESYETFLKELGELQATGLTSLAVALNNALDLLNVNRTISGIDTYGQGRCPFHLEPTVIIVVTDGGKHFYRDYIQEGLGIPIRTLMPGPKLTKEPFRWDQRVFSLVLRIPGQPVHEPMDEIVPRDESQIEKLCRATGGRSYKITSQHVLNQCIDSIVKKIKPGVVIHVEQRMPNVGESSTISFQPFKTMIYVPKQNEIPHFIGHWPIPESHWPSTTMVYLPPRDAHPRILVAAACCDEPQLIPNFPIDKYELEHNPFTLQILGKRDASKVWPVSVLIEIEGKGTPFGYLKANSSLTAVHLFVLPYGHQILFPLLDDLLNNFKFMPNDEWMKKFDFYVKSIPQYYCAYLQSALFAINVPHDLVRRMFTMSTTNYLNSTVIDNFKYNVEYASQRHEKICSVVANQLRQPKKTDSRYVMVDLTARVLQQKDFVSHPMLRDAFSKLNAQIYSNNNSRAVVPIVTSQLTSYQNKDYRNPFDVPRRKLLEEEARMRNMFYRFSTRGKFSQYCSPVASFGTQQMYSNDVPLRPLHSEDIVQYPTLSKTYRRTDLCDLDVGYVRDGNVNTRTQGPLSKDYSYGRFRATTLANSTNEHGRTINVALDNTERSTNIEHDKHRSQNNEGCIHDAGVPKPEKEAEIEGHKRHRVLVQNASEWIEEANVKTRSLLFKDIRRPGRDYSDVLKHLELLQGDQIVRKKYVDMCVKEALRFRRHKLIDRITEWWKECEEECAKRKA